MRHITVVAGGLLIAALVSSGCAPLDSRNLAAQARLPPARPAGPPRFELAAETPLCPVTGRPVNFLVHTTGPAGCVYFCCKDCVPAYEANRAKYADLVAWQREILSYRPRVQVTCPVTGDPVDPQRYTDEFGQRVYFCKTCGSCQATYEDHPERYAAALESDYTYQTRCPVTGVKINPSAFTDLPGGERIYLCCSGCADRLQHDFARYAPRLVEQGIILDPGPPG